MRCNVLAGGIFTTVQDAGRQGLRRFGVPLSGAMDAFALQAANALVGNPLNAAGSPGAAALEFTLDGPTLQLDTDCLVAGAGCGFTLRIGGRSLHLWMAAFVRAGEQIEVIPEPGAGGWGYLAFAGGINTPLVMGSRSVCARAGIGRGVQSGDSLPIGESGLNSRQLRAMAGRWLPHRSRPNYAAAVECSALPGPQLDWLTDASRTALWNMEFLVSHRSDRMGYRLEGVPLEQTHPRELLSEGMPPGSVQLTSGGGLMTMMADAPTTGGYPKALVVTRAAIPLLAQLPLGIGRVRFRQVTLAQAAEKYARSMAVLKEGIG